MVSKTTVGSSILSTPAIKILQRNQLLVSFFFYICKLGEEDYYLENTSGNDIVCVDGRELSDANMKIMSSYKITNREDMEEILRVLERYEFENPSKWNRTIPAMKNEWVVHNACYSLGLQTDRTDDVDLNNEDESLYNLEFITKILGN